MIINNPVPFASIDTEWTLFLDRDGVINHEIIGEYINHVDDFVFLDGVLDAMPIFNQFFGQVLVVTNQRGVAKGLTPLPELEKIHAKMLSDISLHGGKITEVFYCAEFDKNHPNRKPNPGMGFLAKEKYSRINFSRSIMVGNSMSDMEFGRSLGLYTIFLPTNRPEIVFTDHRIDAVFPTLLAFADYLSTTKL